jgi:hypothetical protein
MAHGFARKDRQLIGCQSIQAANRLGGTPQNFTKFIHLDRPNIKFACLVQVFRVFDFELIYDGFGIGKLAGPDLFPSVSDDLVNFLGSYNVFDVSFPPY